MRQLFKMDWCGRSITAGGQERIQEQPSETARKIWKCKRSGDPGSRNRRGAGRTGGGVAEKSVITQEVWNSDP